MATPIARANRVFISSDYGTGGGVVEIKPDNKAQEIWFTKDMRNHHSSSVLIGDYLYGFSSAILTAMKFDTGEIAWRDRSVGKGSLVYADGNLYCFSENGVVGLVEATPTGYKEKGRFRIPQDSLPTWTHPVVAGGRLYLRDQDTIYAYDVRALKAEPRNEASKSALDLLNASLASDSHGPHAAQRRSVICLFPLIDQCAYTQLSAPD